MEDEDFFTTEEVCKLLDKTEQGLYVMIKKEKLHRHKRGSSHRNYFLKTEVEALLKYRKVA